MRLAEIIACVQERWACHQLDQQARDFYPQYAKGGGGDQNAPHGSNSRKELDSGRAE